MSGSEEKKQVRDISVGDAIPNKTPFYTIDGKTMRLMDFIISSPIVLFYFLNLKNEKCQSMLQAYANHYEKIKQMGFEVIAVCPAPQSLNPADFQHAFPFQVLLDKECIVARNLGIANWQNLGDIDHLEVARSCHVIDSLARIHWIDTPSSANAHLEALMLILPTLIPPAPKEPIRNQAPVLLLPKLFELPLCDNLCRLYQAAQTDQKSTLPENFELTLYEVIKNRLSRRVPRNLDKIFRLKGACFMERARLLSRKEWPSPNKVHFERMSHDSTRDFVLLCQLNRRPFEGGYIIFPQFAHAAYQLGFGDAIIFSAELFYQLAPIQAGDPILYITFFTIESSDKSKNTTENQTEKPDNDWDDLNTYHIPDIFFS